MAARARIGAVRAFQIAARACPGAASLAAQTCPGDAGAHEKAAGICPGAAMALELRSTLHPKWLSEEYMLGVMNLGSITPVVHCWITLMYIYIYDTG